MPLKNYKLLVGKVKGIKLDDDSSPHIEILVKSDNQFYRIAVNVRSNQIPHDLLYLKRTNFTSVLTNKLSDIHDGIINIKDDRPDLSIDYKKDDSINKSDMKVVPFKASGPNNDLKEFIIPLLEESILDESTTIYAFGEMWGPEQNKADSYFRFLPGQGIHDIHMNQGSSGRYASTNGSNQDGALFIRDRNNNWTSIFLAFQSQLWDEEINNSLTRGSVSIIAALVNAINPEEGKESVTLFNQSDSDQNIRGWKIVDKSNREHLITDTIIRAGDAKKIIFSGNDARLGNSGGEIKLFDNDGTIVSSVTYKKSDKPEGWSHIFN